MRAFNRNLTRALLSSIVLGFALADATGSENNIPDDNGFWQARVYMRNFHQHVLEEKRKQGASTMQIVSMAETFQVMEAGVQISTWAEWTNYYHAIVLDPPVVFDIRTNVLMDFTTPASACRSYLRASFLRDHDTLLKNADPSETTRLKRSFTNDVQATDWGPKLALFTILLTATTTLDGQHYVMVLWRSQNAQDPTNDLIGLQETFLVYNPQTKSFLVTQNLRHSTFATLLPAAKAAGAELGTHDNFYEKMKTSSFPTGFYTVK